MCSTPIGSLKWQSKVKCADDDVFSKALPFHPDFQMSLGLLFVLEGLAHPVKNSTMQTLEAAPYFDLI